MAAKLEETAKRDAVHCSAEFLEILAGAKAHDPLSRRRGVAASAQTAFQQQSSQQEHTAQEEIASTHGLRRRQALLSGSKSKSQKTLSTMERYSWKGAKLNEYDISIVEDMLEAGTLHVRQNMMTAAPQTIGSMQYVERVRRKRDSHVESGDVTNSYLSDLIRSIDNIGNFSHWYGDEQRAFTKSIDSNGNLEIPSYANLPSLTKMHLPRLSPAILDVIEENHFKDKGYAAAAALEAVERGGEADVALTAATITESAPVVQEAEENGEVGGGMWQTGGNLVGDMRMEEGTVNQTRTKGERHIDVDEITEEDQEEHRIPADMC